jgi:hypothetical protein
MPQAPQRLHSSKAGSESGSLDRCGWIILIAAREVGISALYTETSLSRSSWISYLPLIFDRLISRFDLPPELPPGYHTSDSERDGTEGIGDYCACPSGRAGTARCY